MTKPAAGPTSLLTPVWLVAQREMLVRARSKATIIITGVMLVVTVAGGILAGVLRGHQKPAQKVGVATSLVVIVPSIQAVAGQLGDRIAITTLDPDTGLAQVRSGDLSAMVTGSPTNLTLTVRQDADPNLAKTLLQVSREAALSQQIAALGGDPNQVLAQAANTTVNVRSLNPPKPFSDEQIAMGIIAVVLLYITLMTAGQLVVQGVIEEKTSRVVEVLLAAIRPWQLLTGKVLGIGVVGLVQTALTVTAGLITAKSSGLLKSLNVDLGATGAWVLIWYILGFLTYSVLLAGLGSLVSRQEEASSVMMPVMMVMIIAYIVAASVLPHDPSNAVVSVLAVLPFLAPMLMPAEIAMNNAHIWQLVVSTGLTLIAIPLLMAFASRVYGRAVLRTGARTKLREVLRNPV